jgi:chromate reductase
MKILAFVGSLRPDSTNRKLVEEMSRLAPEDLEITIYSDLKGIPAYDEIDDTENPSEAITALREAAQEADGFLFATPEYNASVPGFLKNAIDWLSRPYATNPIKNKPALVVGASKGMFGAVWAQDDLRRILKIVGARVMEEGFSLPASHEAFDEAGYLVSEDAPEALQELLEELERRVRDREAVTA